MTNKFLKSIIKDIEESSIAEDGTSYAEFSGYIDTGCYILNGQISGSLLGGHPNNKILTLAGETTTGKTFMAISLVKTFFDQHKDACAYWFLAEPAVTKQMLTDRGIDANRVAFGQPDTVQEWTFQLVQLLDAYMALEKKPPLIVVLDSLGALSTIKELDDIAKQDDVRDFTKAPMIKRAFRTLDKKLAAAGVPLIVTNHIYHTMDTYKPKEMSGGSGMKYAGDCILWLSASKDKVMEGKTVVGVKGITIKSHAWKNRFARQFTTVEFDLSFDTGLDRYSGLLDLGLKHGIIKKRQAGAKGNVYSFVIDSTCYHELKFKDFTPEVWEALLPELEIAARKEFGYGQGLTYADTDADLESASPQ